MVFVLFCLFGCVGAGGSFKAGFPRVALTVQELALYTRLASNSRPKAWAAASTTHTQERL